MNHGIVTECSKRRLAWELTPAVEAALDYGPVDAAFKPRGVYALRDGKSYVYFIGGDDTPIKIGFSNAPHERLASLQTAHWAPLRILAKVEGTLERESSYHDRFYEYRMSGEWFARASVILAEIERINAGGSWRRPA